MVGQLVKILVEWVGCVVGCVICTVGFDDICEGCIVWVVGISVVVLVGLCVWGVDLVSCNN